jgi:hypothetical protein
MNHLREKQVRDGLGACTDGRDRHRELDPGITLQNRAALRMSCRSAIWPVSSRELSLDEAKTVAANDGVDASDAVKRIGVQALAQHLLTLDMLLRIYRESGTLPKHLRPRSC